MKPLKISQIAGVLAAGALALSSGAALAQGVDLRPENSGPKYERGPTSWDNAPQRGNTYRADDYRPRYDYRPDYQRSEAVTQREALRIARRNGVSEVDGVRWNGNAWVIDGADRRGDEMRVEINWRGEIVDVDRN